MSKNQQQPQTVEEQRAELYEVLVDAAEKPFGKGTVIENLEQMSAGASRDTWLFDALPPGGERLPLVLKRDPLENQDQDGDKNEAVQEVHSLLGVDRYTEGRLMQLARDAGVPAPRVHFFLQLDERTGAGFVMDRVAGETLGRRILREPGLASARGKLAYQCGQALAKCHTIPHDKLPPLKQLPPRDHLQLYSNILANFGHPAAGFEYGIRWLEERIELAGGRHGLTHGDFRNGNIIVDKNGLAAVIDWELGHVGDPMCDLGWVCIKSWRYGHFEKPVGGFGEREDMFAGYEAAGGGRIDPEVVHYWEVFGTMRWGLICLNFAFNHLSGLRAGIEPATIGRRAAETEYDMLELLD
jgi:aminoglycoside phosphotransferase (APT) family kinase protein